MAQTPFLLRILSDLTYRLAAISLPSAGNTNAPASHCGDRQQRRSKLDPTPKTHLSLSGVRAVLVLAPRLLLLLPISSSFVSARRCRQAHATDLSFFDRFVRSLVGCWRRYLVGTAACTCVCSWCRLRPNSFNGNSSTTMTSNTAYTRCAEEMSE